MHGSKHELFFWNMVDSLEKIPHKDLGIFSLLQDRSFNVTTYGTVYETGQTQTYRREMA